MATHISLGEREAAQGELDQAFRKLERPGPLLDASSESYIEIFEKKQKS